MRKKFNPNFMRIFIPFMLIVVFGVIMMLVWSALFPEFFSLLALGYWQLAGVLILARVYAIV
jgi:hypothetical protein